TAISDTHRTDAPGDEADRGEDQVPAGFPAHGTAGEMPREQEEREQADPDSEQSGQPDCQVIVCAKMSVDHDRLTPRASRAVPARTSRAATAGGARRGRHGS